MVEEYSNSGFTFIRNNAVSSVDGLVHRRGPVRSGKIEPTRNKEFTSEFDSENSMQRSMSTVLFIAQCFALCPLQGITSHDVHDLR